jgi:transposase InsO family protein
MVLLNMHGYYLRNKSNASTEIKNFVTFVERQFSTKIRAFMSDNGREYASQELAEFFKSQGFHHERSLPYFHESNGSIELLLLWPVPWERKLAFLLPYG